MQLDRMQDIGGIRAVVNNVREVRFIHESLIKGRHKHRPVMPPKDYIAEPKPDGYRGIHQVFKYSTIQMRNWKVYKLRSRSVQSFSTTGLLQLKPLGS